MLKDILEAVQIFCITEFSFIILYLTHNTVVQQQKSMQFSTVKIALYDKIVIQLYDVKHGDSFVLFCIIYGTK